MIFLEIISIFLCFIAGILFSFGSITSAVEKYEGVIIMGVTFFILFLMGCKIGAIPNIYAQLVSMGKVVVVFSTLILLINIVVFNLVFKIIPRKFDKKSENKVFRAKWNIKISIFYDSLLYILAIMAGVFFIRITQYISVDSLDYTINILLYLLLFVIGQQLRKSEIKLKNLLLNKKGMLIAFISILSSWLAGLIAAYFLGLNATLGLALSSGFGWYSLSGVLIGKLTSINWGASVFFIDLIREVLAILLIPITTKVQYFGVGYSGAAAMDFTLPILRKNLVKEDVILCIISGLILSMLTPIFILFWLSI